MNKNYFLKISLLILSLAAIVGYLKFGRSYACQCAPFSQHQAIDFKKFMNQDHTDKTYIPIAILGSGPAGASAAIYGARAAITTVVFQGPRPGGLLSMTTDVANWPGIAKQEGPVIMESVKDQASSFGALFIDDVIDEVDLSQWPYKIHTEMGKTYYVFTLVIATGANPMPLGIPGEQEYIGKGVHTCATCDAAFYKDKKVYIVGGGDSAIEESIQLASYAKEVTIMVRKSAMRAAEAMQTMIKGYPNVKIRYNVEVKEVIGNGTKLTSVKLFDNKANSTKDETIDGIFLAIGHEPNTQLFKSTLPMTDHGYLILEGRTQKTGIPGVYAAGDCHDTYYRQAGTAAGFGIAAGKEAGTFLKETLGFNTQAQEALDAHLFKPEPSEAVVVVSVDKKQDFEREVLNSAVPVVVDFYAHHCPTCMHMLPAFEGLARDYEGRVKFVKVNHETATEIVEELGVQKVPELHLYMNGEKKGQEVKALSRRELEDFIARVTQIKKES